MTLPTYYIRTIEKRVFWMEIEYLKSAVRLLNKDCVNRRGLDLSKKVLWVSVAQRAAELLAIKVGGFKKNSPLPPTNIMHVRPEIKSWMMGFYSPLTYRRPQYLFSNI